MKDFLRNNSVLFSILLGAIYGGVIGTVLALLTGNNVCILTGVLAGAGTIAWTWVWVWVWAIVWAIAWIGALTGVWAWTYAEICAGVCAGVGAGSLLLLYLANRNITSPEALIENHVVWIFSLPIAIFHWLFRGLSSAKHSKNKKSKTKQRAWDVNLVVTFAQGLAEVFPEEWDEWQHWISDMMDSRTRMQAKGMNHRLVSLITCYRLVRFAMHIGIDKVFVLARTTR